MLENVPAEMRDYAQWVCYRIEGLGKKKTKIPYCPQTGRPASVKNPGQWTTYDAAISCLVSGEYHGIGFVLTHNDPFFFVDLDDIDCEDAKQRQIDIAADFQTFQERSPSGKGLHIIGKGSVPSGRRVSKLGIEVYSNERYMTVTGDVFDGKNKIKLEQAKLSMLWEMLGSSRGETVEVHDGNSPQIDDDLTVYNRAATAENGTKFVDLWNGNWQIYHASQSEADLALCNIIAFYTKNKDQLRRMFFQSGLFRPEKSTRPSYLEPMLRKAYDQIETTLNFDNLFNELQEFRQKLNSEIIPKSVPQEPLYSAPIKPSYEQREAPKGWQDSTIPKPPGLMGDIADFMLKAAPRPVPEIAITGAIGLMAGVCGKSYNISNSGLNHYVMVLAETGRGKDLIQRGMSLIFDHFTKQFPVVGDFEGPGDFSSGPSLVRALSEHKTGCFVSNLGEFGFKLKQLSNDSFGPNVSFKKVLLDLYTKSAVTDTLKPTVYSDTTRNTAPIKSPAFSLVGDSQPSTYFEGITEQTVESGLIPRFITIPYYGKRPKLNPNHHQAKIDSKLNDDLNSLFGSVFTYMNNGAVNYVEMDQEAEEMIADFDERCDKMINDNTGLIAKLWTRCHLKVLKLSALVAVGCNPVKPVINPECVDWAINLICLDVDSMTEQFDMGRIGGDQGEMMQMSELRSAIQNYLLIDFANVKPIGTSLLNKLMFDHGIIPMFYLSHKCIRKACFKNDRIGASNAMKRALQNLVDNGEIQRLKKPESQAQFGFSGECFAILNKEILATSRNLKFKPTEN